MERDGFVLDGADSKGREYPEWYSEAPEELHCDKFYIEAFGRLSTMRRYEGASIPFDEIWNYAVEFVGYGWYDAHSFLTIIREMDVVYLRWVAAERQAEIDRRKTAKPKTDGDREPSRRR